MVVDLGCGGGIDVILAARRIGPRGRVVGVDGAPQMVERAKQAVAEAGLQNTGVELRVADIAATGLEGGFADAVISNCVINLCPDKDAAFREAFRILKPGGRLAVSDIVLTENIDSELHQRFQSSWAGCLGGAITQHDYFEIVRKAGFADVQTVAHHVLTPEELEAMACCPGQEYAPPPGAEDRVRVEGKVASIKFTVRKPPPS